MEVKEHARINYRGLPEALAALAACNSSPQGQALPISPAIMRKPSPSESIIHNFGASNDGAIAEAKLLNFGAKLYGTTVGGGAYGKGTVFAITPAGNETVLYNFGATSGNGIVSVDKVINVKGTLYGATQEGGKGAGNGFGTVFASQPQAS